MNTLKNKVALVTGASRGAGRAIAAVLGEAGATVYVTGRTARNAAAVDGLPGTVDDAAEEVTTRGGHGIAVHCDHTVDHDVEALFERIRAEHGRLDLLVNNVWGGYEGQAFGIPMVPFWDQPRTQWESMFVAGMRAQLVTSQLAAPLMITQPGGLIVSTVAWAYDEYLRNIYYDLSKAAVIRMTRGMAHDLRPHGVAAIAVAPGFMRTERILAAHAAHPFDLSITESPEYLGRAVRALAEDPNIMNKSGQLYTVGDLAREYGFTDIDGRQPAAFRFPTASTATEAPPGVRQRLSVQCRLAVMRTKSHILWSFLLCGPLAGLASAAQTVTQPFLGIKLYHRTETSPRPLNINVAEIDLTAPGLSFLVTPRGPSPQPVFNGVADETVIQTPRQFVNSSGAQLAVNASFYAISDIHTVNGLKWTNNLGLTASKGDAYSPWLDETQHRQ